MNTALNILDDSRKIALLDESHCHESIVLLSKQCESAWEDVKHLKFPPEYSNSFSIIFCGMGGSAYGARIIKSLFPSELKIPVDIISDYHIPFYANENTLVIIASYSGGTEEALSCADEAINKKCRIIGISSGGKLSQKLKIVNKPFYQFKTEYNPSGQPRLGQGYMQMGQMGIMNSLGLVDIPDLTVEKVVGMLDKFARELSVNVDTSKNQAKIMAADYSKKIINLIAAEFLEGSVHAIRNPFHETGKHFANYFIVPELNHHLMEGLSYPNVNREILHFVLINSDFYSPRIKERMKLTKEVIMKNNITVSEINLKSGSKIEQVFELIQLGSFITFYLAMLHNVNPAKIPWVDYFKNNLK